MSVFNINGGTELIKDSFGDTTGAVTADVACEFAAICRVADVNRLGDAEVFGERSQVVGIGVHFVSIPCLGGTAVPTPVMRDDAEAALPEEHHLGLPFVSA